MNVAVWDTYVDRTDGQTMHFDILVEEGVSFDAVRRHGADYLDDKDVDSSTLTTEECQFCHVESATQEVRDAIESRGYAIVELANCS
jgi:hypothetical protein